MSRISLDEARELWLHADDEELRTLAPEVVTEEEAVPA